jgi:F0F1-type ATP synthase epsilon subunit
MVWPDKKVTAEIAWLELNTPTGNYVIQPGHAPMILALSPRKQLIYALKSGKEEVIMVERGIAEITRTNITLLLSA